MTVAPYARAVGILWIVAVLAICIHVAFSPHKQSSYAADYAPAGRHWLQGEEIYSRRHHFVYSPPVAALLVPFAVLPDAAGGVLWRLASAALLFVVASAWLRCRASGIGAPPGFSSLTALLLLLPLAMGNLNLGQMNVLVLVLVTGGVLAVEQERWTLAAVLLAAPAFIKIYPLAIGLLLALLYPRQLSWRLGLAVLGLLVASLGLQRPGYVWTEYHQWFAVLGRDDRLDVDLYATWRDFGYLLRACNVPFSDRAYRCMEVGSGGVLAAFLWWGQQRGRWTREQLLGGVFCLGCAWMMLFGPATEAATYVVLALPVCGLVAAAWNRSSGVGSRIIFTAAYVLLLLADVINPWFHGWTHHLFVRALQPVAALIFAGGVVWTLLRPSPADAMLAHADDGGDENSGGDRRVR